MSAVARLRRLAFMTSRLAEFCSRRELVAQTGHSEAEWPVVVLKELTDNALDICEEMEILPVIRITVCTNTGQIVISDNGPGIAAETIAGVLDYHVKVSSREAYRSPSRGQQGNALKCIIPMPFALSGTSGETVIESRGLRHRITFTMDPVRREPKIELETRPSDVQNGTRVVVHWPQTACSLLREAKARFVQTASWFAAFNPHLALHLEWDGKDCEFSPTEPTWRKWRTRDPTSSHWYDADAFSRYIAAHIARDEDQGECGRTVRQFIGELRGLKRSGIQKLVLAQTGLAGKSLADFFKDGRPAVEALLGACQQHTQLVKPEHLGVIGPDHLRAWCCELGGSAESFQYKRHHGFLPRGEVPYTIEAAFVYRPAGRVCQVVSGINFSAAIGSTFERLGYFRSLSSVLGDQLVNSEDPVTILLHYVCPVVDFADRGKGLLALPNEVGREIISLVEAVTKGWEKQKRREFRSEEAAAKRHERFLKELTRQPKRSPTEPTGPLAEKIIAEAAKLGVRPDDLAVLSPDRDPYLAYRHLPKAEWFASMWQKLVPNTNHVRGFFYLLFTFRGVWPVW